jgi:hypothetical protein
MGRLNKEILYVDKEFGMNGFAAIQHLVQNHTIRHIIFKSSKLTQNAQSLNDELSAYIAKNKIAAVAVLPGYVGRLHDSRCRRDDHASIIRNFPLVIRNYWAFDCDGLNNVVFAPLMIKHPDRNIPYADIYSPTPSTFHRRYLRSFYSSLHPTLKRDQMVYDMLQLHTTHPQYKFSIDYRQHRINCNISRARKRKKATCQMNFYTTSRCCHLSLSYALRAILPRPGGSSISWREEPFPSYQLCRYLFPCNITSHLVCTTDPVKDVLRLLQILLVWKLEGAH